MVITTKNITGIKGEKIKVFKRKVIDFLCENYPELEVESIVNLVSEYDLHSLETNFNIVSERAIVKFLALELNTDKQFTMSEDYRYYLDKILNCDGNVDEILTELINEIV